MKKIILALSGILCLYCFFSLTSCNSGTSAKLTHEDSVNICKAMQMSQVEISQKAAYVFKTDFRIKSVIDSATATKLHQAYIDNPIATMINSNNELVRGFYINAKDLGDIYKTGKKGARIYMGYDGAKYRIMLVGVDQYGGNDLSKVTDDFIPCPTECPDGGGYTTEIKRQVLARDLNYLRTDGNEIVLKGFNSTEYRRQYQ